MLGSRRVKSSSTRDVVLGFAGLSYASAKV